MATKRLRLRVELEKPLYEAVAALARKAGVSLSLKARDLIREAILHLEDVSLAQVAEERASRPAKLISRREMEARLEL